MLAPLDYPTAGADGLVNGGVAVLTIDKSGWLCYRLGGYSPIIFPINGKLSIYDYTGTPLQIKVAHLVSGLVSEFQLILFRLILLQIGNLIDIIVNTLLKHQNQKSAHHLN